MFYFQYTSVLRMPDQMHRESSTELLRRNYEWKQVWNDCANSLYNECELTGIQICTTVSNLTDQVLSVFVQCFSSDYQRTLPPSTNPCPIISRVCVQPLLVTLKKSAISRLPAATGSFSGTNGAVVRANFVCQPCHNRWKIY